MVKVILSAWSSLRARCLTASTSSSTTKLETCAPPPSPAKRRIHKHVNDVKVNVRTTSSGMRSEIPKAKTDAIRKHLRIHLCRIRMLRVLPHYGAKDGTPTAFIHLVIDPLIRMNRVWMIRGKGDIRKIRMFIRRTCKESLTMDVAARRDDRKESIQAVLTRTVALSGIRSVFASAFCSTSAPHAITRFDGLLLRRVVSHDPLSIRTYLSRTLGRTRRMRASSRRFRLTSTIWRWRRHLVFCVIRMQKNMESMYRLDDWSEPRCGDKRNRSGTK